MGNKNMIKSFDFNVRLSKLRTTENSDYRVSQKDRYGQIWLFYNRGRNFNKIFFHGIEDWLLGYTNVASLFA